VFSTQFSDDVFARVEIRSAIAIDHHSLRIGRSNDADDRAPTARRARRSSDACASGARTVLLDENRERDRDRNRRQTAIQLLVHVAVVTTT
jgi:hypothetical protein